MPFRLLREEVEARITAKTVEIFHRGKLVATHPRSLRAHRPTTTVEHMPSSHQRYRNWTHERILREAAAVGHDAAALIELILRARPHRGRMYSQFDIAKGSGRVRTIMAPDRRLKIIQQTLALLLDHLYRRRNPVHGFVPKRSVKTNAEAHGRRRFVVNLDLKDFFPTITEKRVLGLLRSLGVDKRVSEIVARPCCNMGQLPQGAPTSPVLSNMV